MSTPRSRWILPVLLACSLHSKAQYYSLPTEYGFSLLTERHLSFRDSGSRQILQPYIPLHDSAHVFVPDSHRVFRFINEDPAIDLIFRKHFIEIHPKAEKFRLYVDPLINLQAGKDIRDSSGNLLYINSRGIIAGGTIGTNFYFETLFSENQSILPEYQAAFANSTGVIPGQGRWKTFKENGFDYAFVSGTGTVRLGRHFSLQFGHGKQKVGLGYRSMLLSDATFNYPFLRITQQWFSGKLRYTNIYASLMNLVSASTIINPYSERLFQKKPAAFQLLELQPVKTIHLSFFQGLIWQPGDQKNRHTLGFHYFNPVLFSQIPAYGFDHSTCNLVAAANLLIQLGKQVQAYGQAVIDRTDQGTAGAGMQAGMRYFDALNVKHLTLAAELNEAGTQLYTTDGSAHYSHYNQLLAFMPHPAREVIFIGDYRRKRFLGSFRAHSQNIRNGQDNHVKIYSLTAGYLINPAYNLHLSLGFLGRHEKFSTFGATNKNTAYFFFSVRSSIHNLYFDF